MNALAWVVLAVLALIYIGGVIEWWALWRRDGSRRPPALALLLALVWPWAIGAALLRWIREMS